MKPSSLLQFFGASMLLAGCAGSPAHLATAEGTRDIAIGPETAMVLQQDGMWLASYKDYFAKQMYNSGVETLRRKMGLIRAIEIASGCKVTESTQDPMGLTVQAVVRCDAARQAASASPSAVGPATQRDKRPPGPVSAASGNSPTGAPAGRDLFQAEALARSLSCGTSPRPILAAQGPGFESYSVACTNGDALMLRCEFGNCRTLK